MLASRSWFGWASEHFPRKIENTARFIVQDVGGVRGDETGQVVSLKPFALRCTRFGGKMMLEMENKIYKDDILDREPTVSTHVRTGNTKLLNDNLSLSSTLPSSQIYLSKV